MTDTEDLTLSRPSLALHIVRGHPTDEELAAVAAVLAATTGTRNSLMAQETSGAPRSARWLDLWHGSRSPRSWVTRQGGPAAG
ncbi:acyl-CoA carboxylase epsilon subunit [Streptomyces xanthophaeus]|uniref:acyl-CoA carboxylase epsilon subunit n=1 Tax=Streptomyces xanthophaeus TaxID=67385 RepID=UPI00398FFB96